MNSTFINILGGLNGWNVFKIKIGTEQHRI